MNSTRPWSLWQTFFEIGATGFFLNYTDENIGLAKANVTEYVTTALSEPTQHNKSIVRASRHMSIIVARYPRNIKTAIENCTLEAFANLTRVENITSMDPCDYVPSFSENAVWCVFGHGAADYVDEDIEIHDLNPHVFHMPHLLLYWAPATMLFGPMWLLTLPPPPLELLARNVLPTDLFECYNGAYGADRQRQTCSDFCTA